VALLAAMSGYTLLPLILYHTAFPYRLADHVAFGRVSPQGSRQPGFQMAAIVITLVTSPVFSALLTSNLCRSLPLLAVLWLAS
jgi:hypothetical protein